MVGQYSDIGWSKILFGYAIFVEGRQGYQMIFTRSKNIDPSQINCIFINQVEKSKKHRVNYFDIKLGLELKGRERCEQNNCQVLSL